MNSDGRHPGYWFGIWDTRWVKLGKNPKLSHSQCGRSIKNYSQTLMDAPNITKYGSLVQRDAQIVALRAHCAKCALQGKRDGGHQ